MNLKIHDKDVNFLCDAVLQLRDREECQRFFEDVCTISEIKAMAQRMAVARMLYRKAVYTDIVNETGASTATISRVNRALQYGCDAYTMLFERLGEGEDLDS
ncbi:MAG: TrpR-like protein, YerC/YecD [Clostridia bacterium]|nr:TrpR-like protein, YerC/YecD [Clostridia bacterium]